MTQAFICDAIRTPFGRYGGALSSVRTDDLGAVPIAALMARNRSVDWAAVTDVIYGCANQAGEDNRNVARMAALLAGLPQDVPGATINRFCASSVQTTRMAFHAIKAGEGDVFVSAGVECVSRYAAFSGAGQNPVQWLNGRFEGAIARTARIAASNEAWTDPRDTGGLPDAYIAMGQTAENLARLKGVTRQEMDEYATRSQNLAEKAIADGFFEREITPITLPDGTVVSTDDGPRAGSTVEAMARLKPVFRPDGLITAGNACPLNDGASAVIVMSDTKAKELGLTPLARIVSTAVTGLSPEIMGYGPVEASRLALQRAGKTVDDIDLVEINEAFAAQVIPSYRDLGIDLDKLNVHGGAIALGHPFGSTGARITGTLLNGLRTLDKQFGVETMCVGGGMGMAMVLERLS